MIIGNMRFNIEKNRIYEPEELADLILQEPYGDLCATTLMLNNANNWAFFTCKCFSEERDGKIFLHLMRDANDAWEDTEAIDGIISREPINIVTDEFRRWLRKKKKRDIDVSIVRHDDIYDVVLHGVDEKGIPDERSESIARDLLVLFFRHNGINDTASLRNVARDALRLYQEAYGPDDDPFVLPL